VANGWYSHPGLVKQQLYVEKVGPDANAVSAFFSRLQDAGDSVGIRFSFAGATGNSRPSHKLIALADAVGGPECQDRVIEALFHGHFENSDDLSNMDFLVDVGVAATGMKADEVQEWLVNDRVGEEVDRDVLRARERLVSAVPTFFVQGKFILGGMQEPSVFIDLFDRILDDIRVENLPPLQVEDQADDADDDASDGDKSPAHR
jgi:predicted DsbA family dithiol-disulfide isomerase